MAKIFLAVVALALFAAVVTEAGGPARFCKMSLKQGDNVPFQSCKKFESCCAFPDGVIPEDAKAAGADGGCCKTNMFDFERCPNPNAPNERECMPGGSPPQRFCQTKVTEGDFDVKGRTCRGGEWCCPYPYADVQWLGYADSDGACCKNDERCPNVAIGEISCVKR